MAQLPKPAKIINYKGLKIPLFQSPVIIKMLGKKRDSFIKWEQEGMIPAPLFLNGTRRYYMSFELQALADVIASHGIPRMELGKDNGFTTDLKSRWQFVRSHVLNGKYPPTPLRLQFKDREELIRVMRDSLGVFGLKGEVQTEAVVETLLTKAQIL